MFGRKHFITQVSLFYQYFSSLPLSKCHLGLTPFSDISVVCDLGKLDEWGFRGAPDWVVEVICPSTAAHDQILKRDLYERNGVKELWLVRPGDRLVMVYWLINGGYGKPDVHELSGTTRSALFPQVAVDWARVLPEPSGEPL